jgi:hypothetical protein
MPSKNKYKNVLLFLEKYVTITTMDYKTIKIEKPQWYSLKNIALRKDKKLQDILKEAIFVYLLKENNNV